jgi:hypothetical protein
LLAKKRNKEMKESWGTMRENLKEMNEPNCQRRKKALKNGNEQMKKNKNV